jgi:hypothetical protein
LFDTIIPFRLKSLLQNKLKNNFKFNKCLICLKIKFRFSRKKPILYQEFQYSVFLIKKIKFIISQNLIFIIEVK